ncbi:MAG: NADH-quinone oxidoreductase subunit NuoN [Porticoccaceae bacterium]
MIFQIQDLIPLLPILLTAATAVSLMLAIAVRRSHGLSVTITLLGLSATFASLVWLLGQGHGGAVTTLLFVDNYALVFMALITLIALVCVILAHGYLGDYPGNPEELYLLLLIATAGALVLVAASHLAALFIGLEMMSIPLYGLVAYTRGHRTALESGIKYLVLSAAASAFLLFGSALIYAETGTLSLQELAQQGPSSGSLMLLGSGMMLVAIAFKLSVAPFHLWTPDVYQGAPAPVGAFLATASKLAVFAVFLRFLVTVPATTADSFRDLIGLFAVLSILVGNLLALTQTNLKRLLGYSSIAHFGYLLVAVMANLVISLEAILVYLIVYVVATLGAFAVLALMSRAGQERDADSLADYRGLFWTHPALAVAFTLMLLSLAGIPFTAGFIGKFYIFTVGVQAKLWLLLGVVVVGSAIGVFYYLRTMVALFQRAEAATSFQLGRDWGQRSGGMVVLALFTLTLVVGVYPQPLLDLLHYLMASDQG